MKFLREALVDMIYGDAHDDFELIEDEIVDNSRWSIQHTIVFKHKDKFYASYYSVGATEYQDESPWEFDGPEIECTEVKPVEVTTIKYVKV